MPPSERMLLSDVDSMLSAKAPSPAESKTYQGWRPRRISPAGAVLIAAVVRLALTLILSIGIKFKVRAMNPSRLSVAVKNHLDRHSTSGVSRNSENHSRLDFGSRCA